MFLFPQVLCAFITYGLSTSSLIVLGSVATLIFGAHNFTVGNIGVLGFVSGLINDYLARRNNGIYETQVSHLSPRLIMASIVLTIIFSTMAFFGFGIPLHNQLPWIRSIMYQSILGFGLTFLNIAVYIYITPCLRDHALRNLRRSTFEICTRWANILNFYLFYRRRNYE